MRAYSLLPVKILFIRFHFPTYFRGLMIFLAFIFFTNLYAHSLTENPRLKTPDTTLTPLKITISNDSIVSIQNALLYPQDSLSLKKEIVEKSDSILPTQQTVKIYIASGTTLINADNLQNASLFYLDQSVSTKKVLQKEKKNIPHEVQTQTVPILRKKAERPSLIFTSSKSKEHFTSHLRNDLAVSILSNSYKILKPSSRFNLRYTILSQIPTIPYLETMKDGRNVLKSNERAPPLSLSIFI